MTKLFKWMLYFCLFFGAVGFGISSLFMQFPVLETGAKSYIMTIKEGKHSRAYSFMSKDFRSKVDYESFVQGLRDTGLYYATDWKTTWTEFDDSKTKGVAVGVVTLKRDHHTKKIPVEIRFVHEGA